MSEAKPQEGIFHIKDGQVFIKDALNGIRTISSISEALNAPVEAKPIVEDKIREIVSRYVTGELYEFEDELVDELKTLFRQDQQETDAARMAELVNSAVSERIRKELRPGGILWGAQNSGGSLARCRLLFVDTKLPAFGGFPSPKRKLAITISGLEEWKGGIVSGTTVIVNILQGDKIIHSELFSGKASSGYTRQVEVSAAKGDLVVAHNRPDLPHLKITAEFVE